MSPGIIDLDYNKMWEEAKGSLRFGRLNVSYDLTGGLSKEEFIRQKKKIFEPNSLDMFITKTGRIIIPSMNIY